MVYRVAEPATRSPNAKLRNRAHQNANTKPPQIESPKTQKNIKRLQPGCGKPTAPLPATVTTDGTGGRTYLRLRDFNNLGFSLFFLSSFLHLPLGQQLQGTYAGFSLGFKLLGFKV